MGGTVWGRKRFTGAGSTFYFTLGARNEDRRKRKRGPDFEGKALLLAEEGSILRETFKKSCWSSGASRCASSPPRQQPRLPCGKGSSTPSWLARTLASREADMLHEAISRSVGPTPPVVLLGASGQRNRKVETILKPVGWLTKPVKTASSTISSLPTLPALGGSAVNPVPAPVDLSVTKTHRRIRILVAEDNPINQKKWRTR